MNSGIRNVMQHNIFPQTSGFLSQNMTKKNGHSAMLFNLIQVF